MESTVWEYTVEMLKLQYEFADSRINLISW